MTTPIVFSIYIPRVLHYHNFETICYYMSYFGIGTVCYVDFTTINATRGFAETMDPLYKSAFVHFSALWTNETFENKIILKLTELEYWICLKNLRPVQRSLMNLHQIVDNALYLESQIKEQAKLINLLTDRIVALENKQK